MIEEVIHYICDLPTIESAPIRAALRQSQLLKRLGSPPKINVFIGQANLVDAPYAYFFDDGERLPGGDMGLGGGSTSSSTEYHVLKIEYCATGDGETDYEATARAGAIKQVVEAQMERVKGNIMAGVLKVPDLGGTNSYWQVSNIRIDVRTPEKKTSGPGSQAGLWTARRMSRYIVTVDKVYVA